MPARPIVGSFAGNEQVRRALARLHAAGIRRDAISLLMAEANRSPRFGLMTGYKLPEGTAFGAALGGVLGAVVGVLLVLGGITGGSELGAAVAGLAGAGIGGGIGSLAGAVFGLSAPEYRAKLVEASGRGGQILVAVWVEDDEQAARVAQIFARQ